MTPLKIGSRVITRKFSSIREVNPFVSGMNDFIDKEGEITSINDETGNYKVHGWWWPPSAVEPVEPPFQPEYGREYEFSDDEEFWSTETFVEKNPIECTGKYITVSKLGTVNSFKHCRPIRNGLEDELHEVIDKFNRGDGDSHTAKKSISEIVAKHRTEPSEKTKPTDEEIERTYQAIKNELNIMSKESIAVIATVNHFIHGLTNPRN